MTRISDIVLALSLVVTTVICSAPPEWTCAPSLYNNSASCECNCGAWDPDCARFLDGTSSRLAVSDCLMGSCAACLPEGGCTYECTTPTEWTCDPIMYGGRDLCDCDCGLWDPDCNLGLDTLNCAEDAVCVFPEATCRKGSHVAWRVGRARNGGVEPKKEKPSEEDAPCDLDHDHSHGHHHSHEHDHGHHHSHEHYHAHDYDDEAGDEGVWDDGAAYGHVHAHEETNAYDTAEETVEAGNYRYTVTMRRKADKDD